jgi:hypothetical protein
MATYTITIDERTLDGKNILALLKKSKDCIKFEQKEKLKDPTKMTKSEFEKKIRESLEQARRGELIEVKKEDFSKFLGLE